MARAFLTGYREVEASLQISSEDLAETLACLLLARVDGKYCYAPAFVVNCIDTTGAGDVFHGAFCYAVLQGMPIPEALDFCNAMAALNCTALGARGAIRGLDEVAALMQSAERRSHPDYAQRAHPR